LKALLEQAGVPVDKIRKISHNMGKLLREVGKCKVKVEVYQGHIIPVSAMRIRSINLDSRFWGATVGKIVDSERDGASAYPNNIRYGPSLREYPARLKLQAAIAVHDWAIKHWDDIRVPAVKQESNS
jgi:hypothetical protein